MKPGGAKGHTKYKQSDFVLKHRALAGHIADGRVSDYSLDRESVAEGYTELVERYNTLLAEMYRISDNYNQLLDKYGAFYHVEVTEPVYRIDDAIEKATRPS